MGLSSAQARLLTITARKSDCEFQSMNLSHQKIALSRDMERVTNAYQDSLNKTKLMFDYQGTGTSNIGLSYNLLMTPSIYNDYYPKFIVGMNNRTILDSTYAAAARAAGIPAEGLGGTASSDIRNAFIEALAKQNTITNVQAQNIMETAYNNTMGLGNTVEYQVGVDYMTYDDFIEKVKKVGSSTATWASETGEVFQIGLDYEKTVNGGYENNGGAATKNNTGEFYSVRDNSTGKWTESNKRTSPDDSTGLTNFTLAELLSGEKEYVYNLESTRGYETPIGDAAWLQQKIVGTSETSGSFLNWMIAQFQAVLGGSASNDAAIAFATNTVVDMIFPDNAVQDAASECIGKGNGNTLRGLSRTTEAKEALQAIGTAFNHKHHESYRTDMRNLSVDYIGCTYKTRTSSHDHYDRSSIAIDLNNLAKVFLTAFVEFDKGLENTDYSYNIGKLSDAKLFDPSDSNYKFAVIGDTEYTTNDDSMNAQFYDALFNQICVNGWMENDQITDSEYLQQMLKSGLVVMSSILSDNYYHQSNYANDRSVAELNDTEAVAQAEAKYNAEKVKIENKENAIDIKMRNLDTEITSLDKEYDTTQSIIKKAIQSSFQRYNA